MGRRDIETQLLHQTSEPGSLALGEVEHEPGQGRGVDDRMLERALEPAANEPAVEGVVTVLDQNGALCESQERSTSVAKLRCSDQHRTVDVMALLGVRVDRSAAVDERVEKGERTRQLEPLGAELEDQERSVARRLDIDRHELGVVQRRLRTELGRVDSDLLPLDELGRASWFQEDRFHAGRLSAERRNWISSLVIALSSRMAAA